MSTPASQERLHALDAVRGFALLLGIVFHASVSFVQTPHDIPIWIVTDNSRSIVMSVLFFVLHIFRMTTFFIVAGFFAHMSFHKKGLGGFIRDRLKRIAVPLVVGWPILFALIVAATIWGAVVMAHGRPLPPAPAYAGFPAFPLTHLWFLYVLLLLYAVTLTLRGLVAAVDRTGHLRAAVDRVVHATVRNPVGFVVFATPLAVTFVLQPAWLQWVGIFTPDGSLVPNAMAAVGFFTAFGFGFLLHRQTGLLEIWRRRWPLNLALALGFTAICLVILGPLPVLKPAPHNATTVVYAVSYAFAVWTWSFAFIGFALRFMANHSPARRYIADASYWLYLVHVPLVMALQVAVSQLPWPWFAKYPLVLAITFPVLFASYHLFVRYSFIGAILNGRRESRSNRPAVPAAMEPAE
ncbi:MAG: acyltransferase family protein [Alphaproteobacteria bacterium]|nr:acyltransferase family protein [Alphaproteobacteria bacterium]MBL6939342.1 acyltransferase family protein [Alphaproteobacteria bacterium]MBL7097177.1 acyltransferase family protein [Alphaproteobacteria bacterium]